MPFGLSRARRPQPHGPYTFGSTLQASRDRFPTMAWRGHLALDYRVSAEGRTVVRDTHSGPLRVLKSLYPEGDAVCHSVLVHPPGGIVGGDVLEIDAHVARGAHALVTTAGATRFYRSLGDEATQSTTARVDAGARLEWLPLETIAFSACLGRGELRFELAAGAEMLGWDVVALGLPTADRPFEQGRFTQHIELPGAWLERGVIDANDTRLLESPLGFADHRVMGTLWFGSGSPMGDARRSALLDAARAVADGAALSKSAGATSPCAEVVLLRVLGHRVEPVMALLTRTRAAWRHVAWGLDANPPRVWRT